MVVLLDHVTTYANVEEVLAHLETYRRAGFIASTRAVKHAHGVESVTLRFGDDYLELLGVADVELFVSEAPMNDRIMCAGFRPFGLGLKAADLSIPRAAWLAAGVELPEPSLVRATDTVTGELLEFRIQQIPLKAMRGASCFVVEKSTVAPAAIAPNGVHALTGITLVASDEATVAERHAQWSALLDPAATGTSISLGGGRHRVSWQTPAAYEAALGLAWRPAKHPLGELGAVHLASADLATTERFMGAAGRTCERRGAVLVVAPNPADGMVLAISERAPT